MQIYDYAVCRYAGGACAFGDILAGLNVVLDYIISNSFRRVVVNLSFGGRASTRTQERYDQILSQIYENGGIMIAAAGNHNHADACTIVPAFSQYVIAVGAYNEQIQYTYFTNIGDCVEIWGPGILFILLQSLCFMSYFFCVCLYGCVCLYVCVCACVDVCNEQKKTSKGW